MIKEYNKYEQSQQKTTSYNSVFAVDPIQFVYENFTKGERLVIGALMTFKDYKEIYPSQPTLAAKACMSERTVSTTVKKLKQFQLINVTQRMNASLVYILSDSLLSISRQLTAHFFLAISLLLSPTGIRFSENCDLIRDKDLYLRITTTTSYNRKSDFQQSNGVIVQDVINCNKKSIADKKSVLTDNALTTIIRKNTMSDGIRKIINEILQHIPLSHQQIIILEDYSDSQLRQALNSTMKKDGLERPDLYFFAALKGITQKETRAVDLGKEAARIITEASDKRTQEVLKGESSERDLLEQRFLADEGVHLEGIMKIWQSFTPEEKEALYKDYTCNPRWSPSWRSPEAFLRQYARYKQKLAGIVTPKLSDAEQLKKDLENEMETIRKVAANKIRLLSQGYTPENVGFCDVVIDGAKKRAAYYDSELKKIKERAMELTQKSLIVD